MSRSRELVVGIVILAGMGLGVVGSLWLSGSGFGRPAVPLDVMVADVGQLREGNAVKYRGVPVGRVDRFDLSDAGDGILIRLLLDTELPPIADAAAIVAPESLFGEWQVEIVSRERFPNFDYFEVPEGAVPAPEPDGEPPPVLGGFTMPDITRLTAAANDISQNLSVLTDRVDRAFNEETAENVRLAIENIQDATRNLRVLVSSTNETFEDLKDDVSRATTDIGAAASVARSALERTDQLLASGRLDSILTNVSNASRDMAVISEAVGSSSGEMQNAIVQADSVLLRMGRIAARIENGEGVLGQLLTEGGLVAQASDVLVQLDLLLADLRENPKRYVRLSIF